MLENGEMAPKRHFVVLVCAAMLCVLYVVVWLLPPRGTKLDTLQNPGTDHQLGHARIDRDQEYNIVNNFLMSRQLLSRKHLTSSSSPSLSSSSSSGQYDVTLVTQCTANHLHYIPVLAERWRGPVSITVFTYHLDFDVTIASILRMRICNPEVAEHVTFHLVFPKETAQSASRDHVLGKPTFSFFEHKNVSKKSVTSIRGDQKENNDNGQTTEQFSTQDIRQLVDYLVKHKDTAGLANSALLWNLKSVLRVEKSSLSDVLAVLDFHLQSGTASSVEADGCSSMNSQADSEAQRKNFDLPTLAPGQGRPLYPVNLLRTTAVTNVVTAYVMYTDVDLLPSANLRQGFLRMMRKRSDVTASSDEERAVYVVPAFEARTIKDRDAMTTKSLLLGAWGRGVVRPFQVTASNRSHAATDYQRWRTLQRKVRPQPISKDTAGDDDASDDKPDDDAIDVLGDDDDDDVMGDDDDDDVMGDNDEEVRTSYTVAYQAGYEPYYIASVARLPLYDDRFKGFGKDRQSQVCEVAKAGFRFEVLDNAFLLHDGFKLGHTDRNPGWREELQANWRVMKKFLQELDARYPHSAVTCTEPDELSMWISV